MMILGDDGNNYIDADYRSLRYYHKSSHAGSNLADLLQNLENPYSPRCISWNYDGCNACANGYYLSVSQNSEVPPAPESGFDFGSNIVPEMDDDGSWVYPYWDPDYDLYVEPDWD